MQYNVTIRATVTKTYSIDANNANEAAAAATDIFSVLEDETPEHYEQEILDIEEVNP